MADNNERNDVSLCFQALGIEFGAPPEEVEKAYQKIIADIKRKATSPDPSVRAEAMNDLDLINELYEKIRNSITYSSKLREAENAAAIKASMKKIAAAEPQFKICPSCQKTISFHLKKCPFCREVIRTPLEKLIYFLFSLKFLSIVVLLVAITVGALYMVRPDLFKKSQPSPEVPASLTFSNQSAGSFTNLSGAAKKP
ncbi:MAG: hypothetical protein HXX17_17045 [Geobacteraceae bacterium]|nr:hypothetical protein [Geobacteraceae bacterium]